MKNIRLGHNFAVFILLLSVALFEALQSSNWGKAALWMVIGIVFLLADNFKGGGRSEKQ